MGSDKGRLFVVGIGPGSHEHMTFRARECIALSDVIVGYETYIELVRDLIDGKEVHSYGMQEEVERVNRAIELAEQGRVVSLVSSGDSGIYGMAGLVYEVLKERGWKRGNGIGVEVVPGVTAASAVAALVGSPLMNDFVLISLSDLLTPWEVIEERIGAAAQGDFAIVLYNPKSRKRTWQIAETRRIIMKHRDGSTPVAIVNGAYREMQEVIITDLEHMPEYEKGMGMLTTLVIGNSSSFIYDGLMINPRGYQAKYKLVPEAHP